MLKIGIVGTGNIAPSHIEGYLKFKDKCEIVALVDIYPDKAEKMKKKYDLPHAKIYRSHKEMMNDIKVDLVSICTPPYTHKEIAVELLYSKSNVLLEKPMATSLEECDEIIKAMNESGSRLSIISQNRFNNDLFKIKYMLDREVAGSVVHTQVDSFWWRAHCYYDLWWRGTWEKEGGGCTLNHAVHHIDIMCWLRGMPTKIKSYMNNLSHDNSEVEDYSITISEYDDKSISILSSSLVHHAEEQKLIFQCENAKLQVPWDVYASKGTENGFFIKDQDAINKINSLYNELPGVEFSGHTAQIDNVLCCIENGDEFLINAYDGRNTIEFIVAVYKSYFEEKDVVIPILESDAFYSTKGMINNVRNFHEKTNSIENFESTDISV